MDVLTNGVPNQGKRHNRKSETFRTLKEKLLVLKGVGEDGNEPRSHTKNVFFYVKTAKDCRIWRTMDCRRFRETFRCENSDKLAVNVGHFGAETSKRLGDRRFGEKYSGHV